MSDDEADPELLALLAASLGMSTKSAPPPPPTIPVLTDAQFVYDNSTDVAISMAGTKAAASTILALTHSKNFSTRDWSKHELHPKAKDEKTVDFIFLMDLLNFCFWSDHTSEPFAVEYAGKAWTGYWSLVACIQRALDENIPITSPAFWVNEIECTDTVLKHVFRSSTSTEIPLLIERLYCIREAGYVLREHFAGSFVTCVRTAAGSAAALVNLLVDNFPCLDDRHRFEERYVCFHKRAQILVADLWACFEGESFGTFHDIDQITMFADYRIPQVLTYLSCLTYSPPLHHAIRTHSLIPSGHPWEIQLRGCSIWCVELLRREIKRLNPESGLNAVLIDFFLYDTMKGMEARRGIVELEGAAGKHHRVKSIWY